MEQVETHMQHGCLFCFCCYTYCIVNNSAPWIKMSYPVLHADSASLSILPRHTGADYSVLLEPELQELLPGIINELGSENLDNLKEIAGSFGGADAGAGDDDDDVPDLVENFEEASK